MLDFAGMGDGDADLVGEVLQPPYQGGDGNVVQRERHGIDLRDYQPALSASGRRLPIHNRERIDLDEITRRQGRDPNDDVGRLVIAEQRHSSFFDDRQMAIALVTNHVDRNPCHLFGRSPGGCKGSTKIGEHLACLNR
jgi:hypothetical protein